MHLCRKLLKFIQIAHDLRRNINYRKILESDIINKFYSTNTNNYDVNIKLKDTSLKDYIKSLEVEYETLSKHANCGRDTRWMELQPVIQILKKRKTEVDNINNLQELLSENDGELRKMAEDEKCQLEEKVREIDKQLLDALLPIDKDDIYNSIVLEVQAGIGGQEAMLFAKEIFDMYCNFAQYKGWQVDIAEYLATDLDGIRAATALINGNSVYKYLKHEAGVHRVQRTPATEKSGRVHTSTASVIVLPQPSDIEINIQQKDLKIETKRAQGAGGQHVNTTDSAVRIVHIPTGVAVECQVDRSQIKNRRMAMARLAAILHQKEIDAQNTEINSIRKSQVRTKNRNEKIRTYNYNQDRITDHRLSDNIHNLEVFLEGGEPLNNLIERLDEQYRVDSLLSEIKIVNK